MKNPQPNPTNHLKNLQAGNLRFIEDAKERPTLSEASKPPLAAVLACSDMQARPEEIFGLSSGELYVMQNAGNIVTDGEVAAARFAKHVHGTRVIIVLGHSECRVLGACCNAGGHLPAAICSEVLDSQRRFPVSNRPSVAELGRAHAARMADVLRERLAGEDDLVVAAGFFDDSTGEVQFL